MFVVVNGVDHGLGPLRQDRSEIRSSFNLDRRVQGLALIEAIRAVCLFAKWPINRLSGQVIAAHWLVTAFSTSGKSPSQCAGLNRHEAGNARVLRERSSEPLGPEFCVVHREVYGKA
jgi:hypothetical protein